MSQKIRIKLKSYDLHFTHTPNLTTVFPFHILILPSANSGSITAVPAAASPKFSPENSVLFLSATSGSPTVSKMLPLTVRHSVKDCVNLWIRFLLKKLITISSAMPLNPNFSVSVLKAVPSVHTISTWHIPAKTIC